MAALKRVYTLISAAKKVKEKTIGGFWTKFGIFPSSVLVYCIYM